jgi:hypothetical protein
MQNTAVTRRNQRGKLKLARDEVSHESLISLMSNTDEMKEFLSSGDKDRRHKMMAYLSTLYSDVKVAKIFGCCRLTIAKAYEKYKDELQSALIARNKIIAVEALQSLDVTKIPDERKPRAIKDLVDSAGLANERIKPPEEKKDVTVRELLFRITERKSTPLQKSPNQNDDDIIEGELVEQPQITEKTP